MTLIKSSPLLCLTLKSITFSPLSRCNENQSHPSWFSFSKLLDHSRSNQPTPSQNVASHSKSPNLLPNRMVGYNSGSSSLLDFFTKTSSPCSTRLILVERDKEKEKSTPLDLVGSFSVYCLLLYSNCRSKP